MSTDPHKEERPFAPRSNELIRFALRHGRTALAAFILLMLLGWIVAGMMAYWPTEPASTTVCDSGLWAQCLTLLSRTATCAYCILVSLFQPEKLSGHWAAKDWSQMFAVTAALVLALAGLGRWMRTSLLRFLGSRCISDHIVVIGGGGAGSALLRNLLDSKDRREVFVVLEPDPVRIEQLRGSHPGVLLLCGDGMEARARGWAGVKRARYIFISTGDDARNVELAGRIRQDCASAPKPCGPERIVPLTTDHALYDRIDSVLQRIYGDQESSRSRIDLFNSTEVAARQLFVKHPLDALARLTPSGRGHLLLIGSGDQAEAVLRHALQFLIRPDLLPPRVTILCRDPERERRRLLLRYPELDTDRATSVMHGMGIRIEFLAFDGEPRSLRSALETGNIEGVHPLQEALAHHLTHPESCERFHLHEPVPWPTHPVTTIVIAWGNDLENLNLAFALQRASDACRRWLAPTYLRLRHDDGLGDSLAPDAREFQFHRVIDTFGRDDEVCTFEEIFERPWNGGAERLHQAYGEVRVRQGAEGPVGRAGRAPLAALTKLEATFTRANWFQLLCTSVKYRAAGYRLVTGKASPSGAPPVFLHPEDFRMTNPDILAALPSSEHDRWNAERCCDGWSYNAERDNLLKLHPCLVPWKELDYKTKEYDQGHIKRLAEYRGTASLLAGTPTPAHVWRKEVVIGAVGPLEAHGGKDQGASTIEAQRDALKKTFAMLKSQFDAGYGETPPAVTLLTCGWSGFADIFLEVACEAFNEVPLRVLCVHGVPLAACETQWKNGKMLGGALFQASEFHESQSGSEIMRSSPDPPPVSTYLHELREGTRSGGGVSWMIDLFPPGLSPLVVTRPEDTQGGEDDAKGPPAAQAARREELFHLQWRRAAAYVVERSEFLVAQVTDAPDDLGSSAYAWWTGAAEIPAGFRTPGWIAPHRPLGRGSGSFQSRYRGL